MAILFGCHWNVPWVDKLKNKVQIHHLHVKHFHMVKRLQKSVHYIRYWTKFHEILTRFRRIICAVNAHIEVGMVTSLEILRKNSDLSSAPKRLSYGVKIAKIARGLCFAYDTKLVAMATSLEDLIWTWSRKFTQIPSIWWKDRENRPSRYWDSFAPSKKK